MTEQTGDKGERSRSQEHWSASLRNQATPNLAESAPTLSAKADPVSRTQKQEKKKYEYSFQQYQDKNYDFISKKIGSDDDKPQDRADSTTWERSRGSPGSKPRLHDANLHSRPGNDLVPDKFSGERDKLGGERMGAGLSPNLDQQHRQSPW